MSKHPLTAVIDQAKALRAECIEKARRNHRRQLPFQRSRGVDLCVYLPGRVDPERECEQQLTVKALLASIERNEAKHPGCTYCLDGGVDGATSLREFNDGSYDPLIEEWCGTEFTAAGLLPRRHEFGCSYLQDGIEAHCDCSVSGKTLPPPRLR